MEDRGSYRLCQDCRDDYGVGLCVDGKYRCANCEEEAAKEDERSHALPYRG